ncbi:hypothetical protein AVDCRST_MAG94-5724, partial [uncultured Leptolyngbya sp.]
GRAASSSGCFHLLCPWCSYPIQGQVNGEGTCRLKCFHHSQSIEEMV